MWKRGKFSTLIISIQIILIILYAVFVDYAPDADSSNPIHNNVTINEDPSENSIHNYYAMFQDVHVMMFIGFGFLMTFLKKYGLSSVGINFLIAAIVLQWGAFMQGIHAGHYERVEISITSLLGADFSSAAVLISFGAVLGKTSPVQLVVMSIIEILIFSSNEHLGLHTFKVVDVGGSMFVHVFGAYFGIGVAIMLFKTPQKDHPKNGSNYNSDIFAMIGTIFLWMFWPSFNSALAQGVDRQRAIINTYFALSSCCVTTFAISSLLGKDKFNMVHIQNATLAGGVAIGTTADFMLHPYGSLLIGVFAGILSTVGYVYIQPFLEKRCRIHDTCGVNNLHGMPGIMAGLIGSLLSYLASEDQYGKKLYSLFPARVPEAKSPEFMEITNSIGEVELGLGRTSSDQALYQLIALGVTFLIAIIGGILTGALLRLPIFDPVDEEYLFEDELNWEIEDEDMDIKIKEANSHYPQDEMTKV